MGTKAEYFQEQIIQRPLYKKTDLTPKLARVIIEAICDSFNIECYCPSCSKEQVFLPYPLRPQIKANLDLALMDNSRVIVLKEFMNDRPLTINYFCAKNDNHKFSIILLVSEPDKIIKIGQFPSALDLTQFELKRFQKTLGIHLEELSKAMILYSFNYPQAAFMHLRRLIENFIIPEAARKGNQKIKELKSKKISDQIKELKWLPSVMRDNKIYTILSKGIHQLDDEQCREYYPVIHKVIVIVLSKLIEEEDKEKQETELNKELNKINTNLGNSQ